MSCIIDFAKYFFWEHSQAIFLSSLAIPVALEAISLMRQVLKDPAKIGKEIGIVRRKFAIQQDEKPQQFKSRLTDNIIKSIAFFLIVSAGAALPLIFFPLSQALPISMIAAYCLGYCALFFNELKKKGRSLAEKCFKFFTESRVPVRVVKVIFIALIVIGLGISSYYLEKIGENVAEIVRNGGCAAYKGFESIIPQTSFVVFSEYAIVGVMHVLLGVRSFRKKEKIEGIIHFLSSLFCFIFPAGYLAGLGEMRLHHSFTGLMLLLAPFRGVKFLGFLIAFDSLMYFISPIRGNLGPDLQNYDFMNILLPNLTLFTTLLVATSLFQLMVERFFSSKNRFWVYQGHDS